MPHLFIPVWGRASSSACCAIAGTEIFIFCFPKHNIIIHTSPRLALLRGQGGWGAMDDVAVLLGGIDLSKYASAPGTSAEAEETEDSADHQDRFSSSGLPGREGGEAVGEDGEGADEESSEEEDDDARRAAQFPTISGRRALGHVPWHQRPATQGGPAGYFESSVPEHAQVKSALKRGRSILAKPGMKLFQLQDKTYRVDVETGNATLMLGRLSRTAGVDDAGFQRQKKLITVPFRKRPPKTSLGEPPVLTEPPPHLKERWR